jgi:hypothetical protein
MKVKYINIRRAILWRYLFCIALAFSLFAQWAPRLVKAEIRQIDPFGSGSRFIPNIETGGIETISGDEIIDIIIIGDGYTCPNPISNCEDNLFFSDAQTWYDNLFDPCDGIRPYSLFRRAFRVHAVFEPSDDHASADRESYFRVKVSCDADANDPNRACSIDPDSDWQRDGTDADNIVFRDRLFQAIDDVNAFTSGSLNLTKYPDDMGDFDKLEGLYRNLVVAFLVRGYKNIPKTIVDHLSGFADNVESMTGSPPDKVRVGFGRGWEHEFGHAFAFLKDEYIGNNRRGMTSTGTNPSEWSVFNLSNLTYSNGRCDLLWWHISPGGIYNPNVRSLIGNLFKGGGYEHGVWHSEYQCLINGGHHNYLCDNDDPNSGYYDLRDHKHYCFWCEEIVAIRILEKARQIGTQTPSVAVGKTWFDRWESTLRHAYYTHFDIPTLIAEKDACYALFSGGSCPSEYADCENACDLAYKNEISCLGDCMIREVGNAMYVDSGAGAGPDGSREKPYDNIITAINESHMVCTDPHLVIVKPASYPGPMILDTQATLIAEGCSSVVIGE